MLARRIVVALSSACLLLWASSGGATEPQGHAIVSFEWVEDPGETIASDERVLRIVVKPVVDAGSVQLSYRSPDDISVSPRSGAQQAPPGSDGTPRLTLGNLRSHQTKAVEFVVHAPPGKSGVAVFTVSGEIAPGREFEEKLGWTVGTPTAPTVRHGAAEFPARIEPE